MTFSLNINGVVERRVLADISWMDITRKPIQLMNSMDVSGMDA
jgi:hypothetical protein